MCAIPKKERRKGTVPKYVRDQIVASALLDRVIEIKSKLISTKSDLARLQRKPFNPERDAEILQLRDELERALAELNRMKRKPVNNEQDAEIVRLRDELNRVMAELARMKRKPVNIERDNEIERLRDQDRGTGKKMSFGEIHNQVKRKWPENQRGKPLTLADVKSAYSVRKKRRSLGLL